MTTNAYLITYKSEDGELGECVLSALSVGLADESFARMYPDVFVMAVCWMGEFVKEEA